MADKKQQIKERIDLATQAGRVQEANEFKSKEEQDTMHDIVVKENQQRLAGKTPNAPHGAFDDAEAEARRRQYIGSAIDKTTGKDGNKQTGTPATHTEGNF